MVEWADVRTVAASLPELVEQDMRGQRAWKVRDRLVVWERPLRQRELDTLTVPFPDGPILAARVPDLDTRDARIAEEPDVFFTIDHFRGSRAVLVRLDRLDTATLTELVTEAWRNRAPRSLVRSVDVAAAGDSR